MEADQLVGGRYRLREPVGAGGNGVVWLGVDEKLNRQVALKRALGGDARYGPARIRRLRREEEILARLNHPNIVTLLDVEPDGDSVWLVMEYVELRSLAEQGTLPPLRAARIGAQIAKALQSVHAAGIVHQDVKPGNILINDDDHAKLTDFGSSDTAESDVTVSDRTLVPGTPGYLAPEVADGESPTPASDVFSLGATLFAAVEGVSPYGASDNPMALVRRAVARSLASPRHAGPLAPALSALMATAPARRPTAEQAHQLLDDIANSRPTSTDITRRRPVLSRRVLRRAVRASALVILLGVTGAVLTGGKSGSTPMVTPPDVVGDPHSADPCALVDPNALARFGATDQNSSYGNFNRCDVLINPGTDQVDIKVEIDNTPPPTGQVTKTGGVTVVRTPANNGECDRTLALTDGNTIDVTAKVDNGNGPAILCAMADVATATAVSVVSRSAIPKRTTVLDPHSLFYVDACSLLGSAALNLFPGVDALHPQPDFGSWGCTWNSTTNNESLRLLFDRNLPLTAADGQPLRLSGHAAFDEGTNYGDQSCEIAVVARQFRDAYDMLKDELLLVLVQGDLPVDQMCAQARALAAPAAAKLPAS
jgi:eukaryotic-like serine/threonine-protein kinase